MGLHESPELEIRIRVDGLVLLVQLVGEIDMATAPQLDHAITEAKPGQGQHVDIDLTHVTLIDSSGLALLLKVRTRHDQLILRNAAPHIRKVFAVTGIEDAFTFDP